MLSRHSLFLLLLMSSQGLFSQSIGEIEWTNSFLQAHFQESHRIKAGYLTVPENYANPEGRKLKIAFVVIKSANNPKKEDPIMMFQGGWGASAISNLRYYMNHYLAWRRDLIIYDYRGVGHSGPVLCESLGESVYDLILDDLAYEGLEKNLIDLYDDCLDSLELQNIDFNQYGTWNKSRDGVLLAEKLGYPAYNLVATSYGTRAIQCFIEQSTVNVRSAVLDSNCPVGFPVNSTLVQDYANSLNHILDDCASDPGCNKKYPNLKSRFLIFLNSLEEKPFTVKLKNGPMVYLNREEINAIVHQLLYDFNNYEALPFILHKMTKRSKFLMKRIVGNMKPAVMDNFNGLGLINYVYDHKVHLQMGQELYEEGKKEFPEYHIFDGFRAYFLQDSRFAIDQRMNEPIQSDIPTLILTGLYDPVTPPSFGKFTHKHFSNSTYLEFDKVGHGASDHFCGRGLVENFINDLIVEEDGGCIKRIKESEIEFLIR